MAFAEDVRHHAGFVGTGLAAAGLRCKGLHSHPGTLWYGVMVKLLTLPLWLLLMGL